MKNTVALLILSFAALPLCSAETINGKVQDPTGAVLQEAVISVQHWSVDKMAHPSPDAPIVIRPDAASGFSTNSHLLS